jgi:hypothetical protein
LFRNFLSLASSDAKNDAESEFQVKIQEKRNFQTEKSYFWQGAAKGTSSVIVDRRPSNAIRKSKID